METDSVCFKGTLFKSEPNGIRQVIDNVNEIAILSLI